MTSPAKVIPLYERTAALETVREWILEHDEEIRAMEGALPDELAALLKDAEGEFSAKAESVALMVREFAGLAKFAADEEKRLATRRKHYERVAEGLKEYLRVQMTLADVPKIEGKLCNIGIQKSPPSVKTSADETRLASAEGNAEDPLAPYVQSKTVYSIDIASALIDWKRGAPLPPEISVSQGTHVRIR